MPGHILKIARDGSGMPKDYFLGVLPNMIKDVMWMRTCGQMQNTGFTSIATVSVSADGV